ncbi:MAG: hypothetical protein ACREHV_18040, partial [Rhizomicrobium sp.]
MMDPCDLSLLLSLAWERPLAGVLEALGEFCHLPALPLFVDALGDDFARTAAENAIRKLGVAAHAELLTCGCSEPAPGTRESSTSIIRRRSALRLLHELPLTDDMLPPDFGRLVHSEDPWIAIWASRIALDHLTKPSCS